MALAPASTVAEMLSGVGPPVAIMGTSGNFSRMRLTTSGVRDAAETLSMDAPASRRACMSVCSLSTVTTRGMSMYLQMRSMSRLPIGAFTTTPMAPSASASQASWVVRMPWVVPPPTPQNTGRDE